MKQYYIYAYIDRDNANRDKQLYLRVHGIRTNDFTPDQCLAKVEVQTEVSPCKGLIGIWEGETPLEAAEKARKFIEANLSEKEA